MILKTTKVYSSFNILQWAVLLMIFSLPQQSFCQPVTQNIPTQRLLLQLASCYLNVAKQNQIDIDSGLALASARTHINRMIVIGENFEDIIRDPVNKWVAAGDINLAKRLYLQSKGSIRIKLLNLIGFFYAFQPASRKNDLDSALSYLTRAHQDAEAAGDTKSLFLSLCGMGKCYLERGDLALAAATFTNVINKCVKSGDKEQEAMAWSYWGTYSPFQPATIIERINQIKKANALYEQLNNKEKLIITITNMGYLSFAAGKLDESKQYFLRAYALEKSIGFPYTHYTADLIGVVYAITGDYLSRLRFTMDAVKSSETTKDSTALAYFYANRSVTDLNTNHIEESLEWAQKALSEFKRLGDPAMNMLAGMIAEKFIKLNRNQEAIQLLRDLLRKYPSVSPIDRQDLFLSLARAYRKVDYLMAEKYYTEAENLQNETVPIRGNLGAFNLYFSIGEFYFEIHEYEKSRSYLNKALTFRNDNKTSPVRMDIELYFATIDSASGHFEDAYSHAMKYVLLKDSITADLGRRQIDELRIQYEIKNKDDNIKLLNQQAALQKAQIKQDEFAKKVMIAGTALLLLFMGLLYNRFRLKQRSNNRLELQQKEIERQNRSLQHLLKEKEWLLKEVHHRVKNNLHTIICLLESQAEYLENDALKAIENSQHRIYAMSLIHQKLYQSEEMKKIDMDNYLLEFIRYLDESFDSHGQIRLQLDIEPLQLDISHAIPVALIINEAVTNSIKYAFPEKRKGNIYITMHRKGEQIDLVIADNGIGIDPVFVNTPSESLGLKLIKGLSDDINAAISIENDQGTKIRVLFSVDALDGINIVARKMEKEMQV